MNEHPVTRHVGRSRRFAVLGILLLLFATTNLLGGQPAGADASKKPAVDVGAMHTCRLLVTGAVQCWGWNSDGQIGDGTNIDRSIPVNVGGLQSGVVAISAGYYHTCALMESGAVRCWGRDLEGGLGDGSNVGRNVPVEVRGLESRVVDIAAGANHTCAVLETGAVRCWGENNFGQLGDGSTGYSNLPVQVTGLATGARTVSAGEGFSCAVLTGGGIKCWGRNIWGQLGDGTTTDRRSPVAVKELGSEAASVTAGGYHTCALMLDGSAKCWGNNSYGALGRGHWGESSVPVAVVTLPAKAVAISAGWYHSCVLLETGAVKCWGLNADGQLGDATNRLNTSPTDVYDLRMSARAMSAGGYHSCAQVGDWSTWCWGKNTVGQLGDGSDTRTNVPAAVAVDQSLSGNPRCGSEVFRGDITMPQGTVARQEVLPDSSGLAGVDLCMSVGETQRVVRVNIRSGSAKLPGGLIATGKAAVLPGPSQWVHFEFEGVPPTAPGARFLIEVVWDAGASDFAWRTTCTTGSSAGCADLYEGGSSSQSPGDFGFRTIGAPPTRGAIMPRLTILAVARD